MTDVLNIERPVIHVVAVGAQGPGGTGGSGGGDLFITDVQPTSTGIVGGKTVTDREVVSCLSDTQFVRVHFECAGGNDKYTPAVTVEGVAATVAETATKRWFSGYADIELPAGEATTVTATSDAGGSDTTIVEVLGVGPDILSITFGDYPGSQTQLKAGDQIPFTVTTEAEAVSVELLGGGAGASPNVTVVGGTGTGTITVGALSGAQTIQAIAKNSFGTAGTTFTSSPLTLNQTYPTVGPFTVTYPASQQAINIGDSATVNAPVTNGDTVTYASASLSIPNPSTYAADKVVDTAFSGYVGSGTNFSVTANRHANNASTSGSVLVRIASVEPSAYVQILGNPTRLISSPVGVDYEIRLYPSQLVSAAPTLNASLGAWQGSWANMGAYWKRSLRIADAVPRGSGLFSDLVLTGPSGLVGADITAGSTYNVGGFTSRTITFPAFSRVAALGVAVADPSKVSVVVGTNTLTRYTDNNVRTGGWYPANSDGSYNANGNYVGLSDSLFAGANTTGTLQATVQEVA